MMDAQWRKRAIQNGKSQENLHIEDGSKMTPLANDSGVIGQPGSASVHTKR